MKSTVLVSILAASLVGACGPSGGGKHYLPPNNTPDLTMDNVTTDDAGPDPTADLALPPIGDPNADLDGDGFSPNKGDCNDNDKTTYPGAPELCDMLDHNCNGIVDDICDDDKDGYNICPGDMRCLAEKAKNGLPGGDCNDMDPLVNPGAIEFPGDGVDNNCNGQIDEPIPTCDANLNANLATSYANSMELCSPWLVSASINGDADTRARSIRTIYGLNYKPKSGKNFSMLSTGLAVDKKDKGFVAPQDGTAFNNNDPNPSPMPNNGACGNMGADEKTVHDYIELTLKVKVPTNAKSFSFNFMFDSAEYPEFVGTMFNDKFLVLLDSKSFKGNISFDTKKNPITVNAGFFDVCKTSPICNGGQNNVCTQAIAQLNGTGMEDDDGLGEPIGGGTGWLTTKSPVTPGETATIRFIIFDEGDHIYDSSVIIDNFQWQATGSMGGGPITHG